MDVAELDPHHVVGRVGLSSLLCRAHRLSLLDRDERVTGGSPLPPDNSEEHITWRSTVGGELRERWSAQRWAQDPW
jgi:hypothetical protein